jgi:hypothetical protein
LSVRVLTETIISSRVACIGGARSRIAIFDRFRVTTCCDKGYNEKSDATFRDIGRVIKIEIKIAVQAKNQACSLDLVERTKNPHKGASTLPSRAVFQPRSVSLKPFCSLVDRSRFLALCKSRRRICGTIFISRDRCHQRHQRMIYRESQNPVCANRKEPRTHTKERILPPVLPRFIACRHETILTPHDNILLRPLSLCR